jgi:Ca2+-transporting ATPase
VATDWHAAAPESAIEQLHSTRTGLSEAEAAARLARYGLNLLRPAPPVSRTAILAAQLRGVVVWLLVAAAVTSVLSGDLIEAAAIAVVLLIDVGIGFSTELRARRAMRALLELDVPSAIAMRDGALQHVDATRLVPAT